MKKTKLSLFLAALIFSSQLIAQNINYFGGNRLQTANSNKFTSEVKAIIDQTVESLSANKDNAHILTVGEYASFLNAVAEKNDLHQLYNASSMENVIFCNRARDDFSYTVIIEKEQDPMVGLTTLDAMRYCNWIENGSPSEDAAAILINDLPPCEAATETGAYLLKDDKLISVNSEAIYNMDEIKEKGIITFTIATKPVLRNSPLMMFGADESNSSAKEGEQNNVANRTEIGRANDKQGRAGGSSPAIIQRGYISTGIAESTSPDVTAVSSVNANGANVHGINTSIVTALGKKSSGAIFNGASARTFLAKAAAVVTGIVSQKVFSITSQAKVKAPERAIIKPYSTIANREASQQSLLTRMLFSNFSINIKSATSMPSIGLLIKNAFIAKTAEIRKAFDSQLCGEGVLGISRFVVWCDANTSDEAKKAQTAAYASRDKAAAASGAEAIQLWNLAIEDVYKAKQAWNKVVTDTNDEYAKDREANWTANITWWEAQKASALANNARDDALASSDNKTEELLNRAIQESEKVEAAWLIVANNYNTEHKKALEKFKEYWANNFEGAKRNNANRIATTTRWKACLEAVKLEVIANNATKNASIDSMSETDLNNALQKVQEAKRAWIRSEETSKQFDSKIATTSKSKKEFWAEKEAETAGLLNKKQAENENNNKFVLNSKYVAAKSYCEVQLDAARKARNTAYDSQNTAYDSQNRNNDFNEVVKQWEKALQTAEKLVEKYADFKKTIVQNKANLSDWSIQYQSAEQEEEKWKGKASFYQKMYSFNNSLFSLKKDEDEINKNNKRFNGRGPHLAPVEYAKLCNNITLKVNAIIDAYDKLEKEISDYLSFSQEKDKYFSKEAKIFLTSCNEQAENRGTYWNAYKTPFKENKEQLVKAQEAVKEAAERKISFEAGHEKLLDPIFTKLIEASSGIFTAITAIKAMSFFDPPTIITEASIPINDPKFVTTSFRTAFRTTIIRMGPAILPPAAGCLLGALGGIGKVYLLFNKWWLENNIRKANDYNISLNESAQTKALRAQTSQQKENSTFTSEQVSNDQPAK